MDGDLEAAGGLLWPVSGVTGAVAVTISPDPVSRLSIVTAYSNALAGAAAAVLGVRDAYNCHYYQIYVPVNWTDLRIDPAEFGLNAVIALPLG